MNTSTTETPAPKHIESANLHSLGAYTCTRHPHKPAFCICAKCGAMLCRDCNIVISGRRYCESCAMSDNALCNALERELRQVSIPIIPAAEMKPALKWSELPGALANMFKDSYLFFKTAGKTPFFMSFTLAFIALLPNALITYVFRSGRLIENFEKLNIDQAVKQQFIEALQSYSTTGFVFTAFLATVLQIITFDLLLFLSLRLCTKSNLTFSGIGSIMHFCLIPFSLIAIDTWFGIEFVRFIAGLFMMLEVSTAIRAATNCTLMQGTLALMSFCFLSLFLI